MESLKPTPSEVQTLRPSETSLADQEVEPVVNVRTFVLVTSVYFVYFTQITYLSGASALSRDIAAVVGGSDKSSWIGNSIPIIAVVLSSPISQAADLWGRKWFLVGSTVTGFVGCLIIARTTSISMAIAGAVVAALSFAAQPLLLAIPSEVLWRRVRPVVQAGANITAALGVVFGLLVGGALTRHEHPERFRTYFYIVSGLYIASAIACAVLYNPPPRELQIRLTQREKLRTLDWVGSALLSSGLVLFCMAMFWSQNPFPWTNAHVLATFLVGICLSACLVVYEAKYRKDGMFHHNLFSRSRNYALAVGCIFVEGFAFFTGLYYYPFQIGVLYTSDPLLSGLRLSMSFLVAMVPTALVGWYCTRKKILRVPVLFSFVGFTVFNVLMATTRPGSNAEAWGYVVILGFSLGICVGTLTSVAQFATPPELIATATGLFIATRNLGGAIALAIYQAIFSHTLSHNIARKVPEAVLPLGLAPASLEPFIADLLTGNKAGLLKIPGISGAIIAAGGHAILEAYSVAFRYVWIAAGCFSAVGVVLAFFIIDPKEDFTRQIDAPVEVEASEPTQPTSAQEPKSLKV